MEKIQKKLVVVPKAADHSLSPNKQQTAVPIRK
jgi:hypothetical protein